MAQKTIPITDFSLGQLTHRFAGRVDLMLRNKGAELIQGFVMNKDGGLSRRPGSIFARSGLGITPTTNRLYDVQGNPSFVVFKYSSDRYIGFIKDSSSLASFQVDKLATGSQIMSLTTGSMTTDDAGVALDNSRFYDPGTAKQWLHIWVPDHAFNINLQSQLLTVDTDINQSIEYMGRHIGIQESTGYIVLSEELDLFDFTNNETAVRPLTMVGEFSGRDDLKWIKARNSVYFGTDEGEWELLSTYPFFSEELGGLFAKQISDIGTDQAVYFGPNLVMRDLDRVVSMGHGGGGDFNYQAAALTEQIDNGMIVQIVVNEMGTHRYLHALDADGNLYSYLQAPAQQTSGWVTLDTDVGWIYAFNKELYVAKERNGDYSVEVYPLDELHHPGDRTLIDSRVFMSNDAHGDVGGFLTLTAGALTGDLLPPSTMVDMFRVDTTTKTSSFLATTMTDSAGLIADSLAGIQSLVGYDSLTWYMFAHQEDIYPAGTIRTLPMGELLGQDSSIIKVIIQVENSCGAKVRILNQDDQGNALTGGWEVKTTATPEDGPWEFWPDAPVGTEPKVEIATVDENPLNVHNVQVVVDVGG